jgi:hypothetical protein
VPLRERHGTLPVQRLAKAHIDQLVADLVTGGTKTAKGRTRRPWPAIAVNKMISTVDRVLDDALEQKIVTGNPAVLSRYWAVAVKAPGVRHIKLHGGSAHRSRADAPRRGACRGDRGLDRAFRSDADPRVYAHSQDDALKAAGRSLDRSNKSSV